MHHPRTMHKCELASSLSSAAYHCDMRCTFVCPTLRPAFLRPRSACHLQHIPGFALSCNRSGRVQPRDHSLITPSCWWNHEQHTPAMDSPQLLLNLVKLGRRACLGESESLFLLAKTMMTRPRFHEAFPCLPACSSAATAQSCTATTRVARLQVARVVPYLSSGPLPLPFHACVSPSTPILLS